MKSINKWKKGNIVIAHSGNGTAVAERVGNKIVIAFTDLGSAEYLTMNTPLAFKVLDAATFTKSGQNVTSKTLTLQNGSSAISDAMSMATDKGVARATTLDNTYQEFAKDDNDLKLVSSAHADGDAVVVLDILPV